MKQINKKIISYKVLTKDKEEVVKESVDVLPTDKVIAIESNEVPNMGEHIKRKEVLDGKTYKLKPSTSPHAYYITINNIEVAGKLYPYELFINSKGIEHYKLLGFARLISAIFRKAGDISFLVDELAQIHDPTGSYTSKRCYESGKRKMFNSIEAEIGDVIEEHLLYLAKKNTLDTLISKAVSGMVLDDMPLTVQESWELYEESAKIDEGGKTVTISGATGDSAQHNGTYRIDSTKEKIASSVNLYFIK